MPTRIQARRTDTVTARLTPADRALIEAAAATMGMTRSAAVRTLLLDAARERLLHSNQDAGAPGRG